MEQRLRGMMRPGGPLSGFDARWRMAAVLVVTAACGAAAMWGVDISKVRGHLSEFHWGAVLWVFALYSGNTLLRTLRFAALVSHHVSLWNMLAVNAVGFLAITVVPFRLGEVVRPYLLTEKHEVPFGDGVAATVVERLLDLFALLMLLAAASAVDVPQRVVVGGIDLLAVGQRVVGSSITVLVVVGIISLIVGHSAVRTLARQAARLSPNVGELILRVGLPFVDGLRAIARHPVRGIAAVLFTGMMWTASMISMAVIFQGFGAPLPGTEVLMGYVSLIVASILVPTPGAFGSADAGGVAGLAMMGVDMDLARAGVVMFHLVVTVHAMALGAAFLLLEGWSLGDVTRRAQEVTDVS